MAGQAPERLTRPVRRALESGPGYLSVVSYWEVMIKSMKGTLDVGGARQWWSNTLEDMALTPVLLRPEHVAEVRRLGAHHADPFDRILIGTALAEDLAILTLERGFQRYAGDGVTVID